MTITGVNDAAVTLNDIATVQEDGSVTASGNVLANDSDVDQGTVLTVSSAGTLLGNYGSLVLNTDGGYSYLLDNASLAVQTLAAGQVVTDTFSYLASDGMVTHPLPSRLASLAATMHPLRLLTHQCAGRCHCKHKRQMC